MKRLLLLLAFILPAFGDGSTIHPGGYDPEPVGEFAGAESVIRLVSESIDIRFGKSESEVHSRFIYRSGKESGGARQFIGFMDLMSDSYQEIKVISKLETFINGEKVEVRKERGWVGTRRKGLGLPPGDLDPGEEAEIVDFWVVEVNFPPDKDVLLERKYTCRNSEDAMGIAAFGYTVSPSATWHGSIGQADFHITLDGFTVDDLAFEDGKQTIPPRSQTAWCRPNRSQWTVVSPTELKMTWKDFEPAVHSTRNDIRLTTWSKPPADR